jgi:hypothetical protein
VARGTDGVTSVYLRNRGSMVMPAELSISFQDGTASTVKLPVEMWNLGDRFVYRITGAKPVRSVEVDPRHALPDVDRTNNRWPRGT